MGSQIGEKKHDGSKNSFEKQVDFQVFKCFFDFTFFVFFFSRLFNGITKQFYYKPETTIPKQFFLVFSYVKLKIVQKRT